MQKFFVRFFVLASVAGFTTLSGCGDGKPAVSTSETEATVKGSVIINGKPASKGVVEFDPANHLRKDAKLRSVPINADGTYSLQTLVGGNMVRVRGQDAEKANAAYETIDFDVKPGDNTLEIRLPKGQ